MANTCDKCGGTGTYQIPKMRRNTQGPGSVVYSKFSSLCDKCGGRGTV